MRRLLRIEGLENRKLMTANVEDLASEDVEIDSLQSDFELRETSTETEVRGEYLPPPVYIEEVKFRAGP